MDPKDASTAELVTRGIDDAKELVKSEVALAKDELLTELARVQSAAVRILLAHFVLILAFAMALSAVAFATGAFVPFAVTAAVVLAATGAVCGLVGYRKVVGPFLSRTRQRLGEDLQDVRVASEVEATKREAHGT